MYRVWVFLDHPRGWSSVDKDYNFDGAIRLALRLMTVDVPVQVHPVGTVPAGDLVVRKTRRMAVQNEL